MASPLHAKFIPLTKEQRKQEIVDDILKKSGDKVTYDGFIDIVGEINRPILNNLLVRFGMAFYSDVCEEGGQS